jgi:hypothetical protein
MNMGEIIKNFFSSIICGFKGHIPEKCFIETESYICIKRCKRCKGMLISGLQWKFNHIPPPNSNPKEIEEWGKYCENKYDLLRRDAEETFK